MKRISTIVLTIILALLTACLMPAQVFADSLPDYISEVKVFYGDSGNAENEGSQLVEVGAVSRTELFIVKVWKGLVDNSLKFWEKVTDKMYDF